MALRKPVTSVPEGGNPTLGMEQLPTGDLIRGSDVDGSTLTGVLHDSTGPTGTGPEFEHYNAAEQAIVDGEVAASAAHRIDTANPHAVTLGQVGGAPAAHVGAGGVAEHPVFSNGTEGFVPDPGVSTGLFLKDDGTWGVPAGLGFTLVWRFETSIVMAAPGNTRFRMNNATPGSVTAFAFDDQTRDGIDASTVLNNLTADDVIIIQQKDDASKYIVTDVVLSTDNTGWFQVDVTVADSGTIFDNNADCIVVIVKAAGGGGGVTEAVRVHNTSTQSVPNNTDTVINFQAEDYDTDTMHDNAVNNSRITFTTAGKYLVGASINFAGSGGGDIRRSQIRLNGATNLAEQSTEESGGTRVSHTLSVIREFAAADYVELRARQDSGGGLNIESSAERTAYFYAHRMS